jgi:hypothetical protein
MSTGWSEESGRYRLALLAALTWGLQLALPAPFMAVPTSDMN